MRVEVIDEILVDQLSHFQKVIVEDLPKGVGAFSSWDLSCGIRRNGGNGVFLNFPKAGVEGKVGVVGGQFDARPTFLLKCKKSFIFGVDEKQQVMSFDRLYILEGIMFLVKVDKPGEISRVCGDNVMFVLFCLSWYVAPVWVVFDSKRGLQFDKIAFFFKWSEGFQFER